MKILISTISKPASKLGGPGRFAPALFEKLSEINQLHFISFLGKCFYDKPCDIKYDLADSEATGSSKLANLKKNAFIMTLLSYIHLPLKQYIYKKNISSKDVDIIHAHDFRSVDLLSKFNGIIILTNHFKGSLYKESIQYKEGMNSSLWRKYFLSVEERAIKRADIITFPSLSAQYLLEEDHPKLKEIIKNKASIIYSGIDKPSKTSEQIITYNGIDFSKKIILNIGNHIPDKGVDKAIRVFENLFRNEDCLFVNIGKSGPETDRLKRLCIELNVEDKVKCLGIVPFVDVLAFLSRADYVIHTPRRVVFDLSLLEAMAVGAPIISSKALGNVEALGENHKLFVENTSNDEVVLCFNKNILNENTRNDISKNQQHRFESLFTTDSMVNRYIDLYKSLYSKTIK